MDSHYKNDIKIFDKVVHIGGKNFISEIPY